MKKILLFTMLLSSMSSVWCFNFFKRSNTDESSAPQTKWLQVVVTPEVIDYVDPKEWTSMFWIDFRKVSQIFALSAKPYHKHPFVVKVHTRKLLREVMKHNVWISRFVLETMPAQVPLIIDGQKFVIAYDSELAELLFSLAGQY